MWIDTNLQTGEIIADGRSPEDAAYDDEGHGTHTAGTICGGLANGMAIGVAPGYSAKVIEAGKGIERILTGFDWAVESGCRVVNLSAGIRGYDPFWEDVVTILRQKGIVPCIAAGNEGPGTIRSPGGAVATFTVGSLGDGPSDPFLPVHLPSDMTLSQSHQLVSTFSSSIVFSRQEEPNKPDLMAPGFEVVSAKAGGGVHSLSGTSQATPHVAGTVAILLQAYPTATVPQIEQALEGTCAIEGAITVYDPSLDGGMAEGKERYGYGLIVPVKALAELKKIMSA